MENVSESQSSGKIILISVIFEIFLSLIMIFVLSLLLSLTDLEEKIIEPAIIGISAFSILIGSFFSGREIRIKGIVIGIVQGFMYMFILYMLSSFISGDFSIGVNSLTMIGLGIFAGVIGAIVGVNLK